MNRKYERTIGLVGNNNLEKLQKAVVLVCGLGGVGGYAVEALARSGIGKLILVDNDKVDESNINRQIIATEETIGKNKTEIFKKRINEINRDIIVDTYNIFLLPENIEQIFTQKIDYVIDAIDTLSTKVALWKYCQDHEIEIISSLGMAKRVNPQLLEITKLSKTEYDPMAKALRSIARKNNVSLEVSVIFSKEKPMNNDEELGSMIFVPATCGLMCAYYVVDKIID